MNIILRKVRGIKGLVALMRPAGGPSFGAGAAPGALFAALTSPLLVSFVAIALLAVWALATGGTSADGLMLATVASVATVDLKALHEKRRKAIADARAINDSAKDGKMDAEAETRFNAFMAEAGELKKTIDREVGLQEEERALAETRERERQIEPAPDRRIDPASETREQRATRVMTEVRAMDEQKYAALPQVRAMGAWCRDGVSGLSETEHRALEVTNSASGGYLQPPQEFIARLIQAVDNVTHIRQIATKFTVPQAESLGAPSLDNDPADPTWVGELTIGSEDSTMSAGKRELRPHPLAQFIKVSNTLMRKAALSPEALVRERLAYKQGVVQENAFLNGTGAAQPLGVFTASANGISTGRDVSTGNTTTSIQGDGLIEAKFTLKGQYWPKASWLFHRDAVKQISKLKDGDGQYLWQPGLQPGRPDLILGLPFRVSEYAPNTFTTGLYVGILGDFGFYWIADALDIQLQRLVELYAATNQTGFVVRSETDGMPVLEEAFVRVKLA